MTAQWIDTKGGPSRYILSLARNLSKMEFPVQVLSGEAGEGAAYFRSRAFLREWDIVRILWRFRPDVVHIHGRVHFVLPVLIYKFISGMLPRMVFTFHSQPYLGKYIESEVRAMPDYVGVRRLLARFLLGRCDAVTTVSRSIVDNLNQHYGLAIRRSMMIPSGSEPHSVDAGSIMEFKSKYALDDSFPILATIGVFSYDWKVAGHLVAMESLVPLREIYPRIRLLIAGDGNYRDYLKAAAARLGVETCVLFLGNIDSVEPLLAVTDVYVHMAMNEGCSLAVVEAMMAGKPIVAARRGGTPEIVEDDVSGILIEPRSADLAKAISELVEDEHRRRRLGLSANYYATRNLSWNRIAHQYRILYENNSPDSVTLPATGDSSQSGAAHETR